MGGTQKHGVFNSTVHCPNTVLVMGHAILSAKQNTWRLLESMSEYTITATLCLCARNYVSECTRSLLEKRRPLPLRSSCWCSSRSTVPPAAKLPLQSLQYSETELHTRVKVAYDQFSGGSMHKTSATPFSFPKIPTAFRKSLVGLNGDSGMR